MSAAKIAVEIVVFLLAKVIAFNTACTFAAQRCTPSVGSRSVMSCPPVFGTACFRARTNSGPRFAPNARSDVTNNRRGSARPSAMFIAGTALSVFT